jgi:hypothetical protein
MVSFETKKQPHPLQPSLTESARPQWRLKRRVFEVLRNKGAASFDILLLCPLLATAEAEALAEPQNNNIAGSSLLCLPSDACCTIFVHCAIDRYNRRSDTILAAVRIALRAITYLVSQLVLQHDNGHLSPKSCPRYAVSDCLRKTRQLMRQRIAQNELLSVPVS